MDIRLWKPFQVGLFKIATLRIASLDTWERSTSMPSLFISRTTFKYVIELTSPVSPHLLPELAEPTDPGGEVANLNLRGVRPWCVAPVGQSHVARSHPVQGAHQRQAASDGVAGLNTNLGRKGEGLEIIANMETNQAGNFPLSPRRLDVRHAGRPVQVFRIS